MTITRDSATKPAGLTQRAVRGAAWTLPTSLGSRIVGLVGTLVLARYLAPAEYGEVSAAAIVTVTASSITTFGVGIYLVANPDISRAETFHATCWFLGVGFAAIAAATALSGSLGVWFDAPHLVRFVPLFALSALLERIAFLPERMLVRRLRFRYLSLARASGELMFTGVSVALAASGFGAMAIAWGNVARSALRFLAIVPAVDRREWLEPHRLQLATMKKIVGYGMNVSVASIATFGMRRWDNLLVSRYFGPAVMGAYNYAYNLADTPAVAIGEQMTDVIGASFPHVSGERLTTALVRSCSMMSLLMFPLAFGLGAVAPAVVQTFLDPRWASVGRMLIFLSVLSALRPMMNVLTSYFYASHRPSVVLGLEWASLAAIVMAIATIGRLGIDWTCAAVGCVFVLRTLAAIWVVRWIDGVALSRFLVPMMRPLAACLAMVGAIVVADSALHTVSAATRLLVEVGLGGAVYLLAVLVVARAEVREFLGLLQTARS